MGKFAFSKQERLNKEKWIAELFEKGEAFYVYPLRVIYLPHPLQQHPVSQVLISVSARNFKRAVDRNLLKRRMREAYRLQKACLPSDRKALVACIYTSRKIEDFDKIKASVGKAMESIRDKLSVRP